MNFEFRGKLCGYICADCRDVLCDVIVRLYRNRADQPVVGLSVASPKDTLAILDDRAVRAKAGSLIAETRTGKDGSFAFELGDAQKYEGGPFEIDVVCGSVPRQKVGPSPRKPVQFSITTLQPMWRRTEKGALAYWEYCIPARFWCEIRRLFCAWVICGRVVECDEGRVPVAGVTVSAFDVDWVQDDPLGSATTDSTGHFRIDYAEADFKRTPFFGIDIELFGGPDLYFKVEAPGGGFVLDEPRSRGRDPDRENAGPCFCVELCVDKQPTTRFAWFTHVGDFNINSDIDTTTGKTKNAAPAGVLGAHGGPGYAFFDGLGFLSKPGLTLIGDCPTTHPNGGGEAMRYRFLYDYPASPGTPVPITGGKVASRLIGSRPIPWDFGSGPVTTFQSIWIVGAGGSTTPPPLPPVPAIPTGAGPPPAYQMPDADGWVIVDPLATNGSLSGALVGFFCSTAVPGGSAVTAGDAAGTPPAATKNGTMLRIIFEAEPVTGATGTAPKLSNELSKIYINNWDPVNLLELVQFSLPGANCCTALTTALDLKYTTDHELMKTWALGISSCASSLGWSAPALPSGPTAMKPRGDAGTSSPNIVGPPAWPNCSYTVGLSSTPSRTNGEADDPGTGTSITFCIDR